jgi:hypothetical protein
MQFVTDNSIAMTPIFARSMELVFASSKDNNLFNSMEQKLGCYLWTILVRTLWILEQE